MEEGNQATRQPGNQASASDASRDTIHASRASEHDLRDALARLGRQQEGVMIDAARKLLDAAITELLNLRAGAPPADVQHWQQQVSELAEQLVARDRQIQDFRAELEQFKRTSDDLRAVTTAWSAAWKPIFERYVQSGYPHWPGMPLWECMLELVADLEKRTSVPSVAHPELASGLREAVVAGRNALQSIKVHSAALIDADLVPVELTHAFALHRDWAEHGLQKSADALAREASPVKREASEQSSDEIRDALHASPNTEST